MTTTSTSKTAAALSTLAASYTTRATEAKEALKLRADFLKTTIDNVIGGLANGVGPTGPEADALTALLGPSVHEYRRSVEAGRQLALLADAEMGAAAPTNRPPTPKANVSRTRTEVALSATKPPVLIPESEPGVLDLTIHPLLRWNFHATKRAVLTAIEKSLSHPKKLQTAKEGLAAAKGRPELIEVARKAGLRVVESAGPTG